MLPRAPRHAFRSACQVVRTRDFRLVSDRISNLSVNGMLAEQRLAVRPGDELIVSFYLPRVHRWIDTDARVVRVIAGRRAEDTGPGLGIEFGPMNDEARNWIAKQLRRLPAVAPQFRIARTEGLAEARFLARRSGRLQSNRAHSVVRWTTRYSPPVNCDSRLVTGRLRNEPEPEPDRWA